MKATSKLNRWSRRSRYSRLKQVKFSVEENACEEHESVMVQFSAGEVMAHSTPTRTKNGGLNKEPLREIPHNKVLHQECSRDPPLDRPTIKTASP